MPSAAALVLAASVVSLGSVYVAQYGFGLEPCVLCLWQRVPYAVVILLATGMLAARRHARALLWVCAVVFLIGAGLAFFHTGVERHWWLGTSGCAIQPLGGNTAEDLRTRLLHTAVARCDQIAWAFLGFSMANWNVLYSLGLAVFAALAALRARDDR